MSKTAPADSDPLLPPLVTGLDGTVISNTSVIDKTGLHFLCRYFRAEAAKRHKRQDIPPAEGSLAAVFLEVAEAVEQVEQACGNNEPAFELGRRLAHVRGITDAALEKARWDDINELFDCFYRGRQVYESYLPGSGQPGRS